MYVDQCAEYGNVGQRSIDVDVILSLYLQSRNGLTINTTSLLTEQSNTVKCGDKIGLADIYSFAFKCNPNRNKKCCCDKTQEDILVVDLE